jgi:small-conductance mechanosensitive channel/CRP-like cAMP-binding protein
MLLSLLPSLALIGLALAVLALLRQGWLSLDNADLLDVLQRLAASSLWIGGTLLLIRLLDKVVWDRIAPRYVHVRIPQLLRQVVAVLLFLGGVAAMLNQAWGMAVTALLATTGVMGIVFGLALRNILADFFSGIALNMEQPYRLDDFVMLRRNGRREGVTGIVREINWRSTRLLTPEENLVVIPNRIAASSTIENLSFPSPVSENELEVTLEWSLDPAFVEPVLAAAMVETWAMGATCGEQPPKCRISKLDGAGVTYKVLYMIDPRRRPKGPARHTLLSCLHRHLRHAGLHPVPSMEGHPQEALRPQRPVDYDAPADQAACLAQVRLFAPLSGDERLALVAASTVRRVDKGAAVVRSGDAGASMFVVAAGVLEVLVTPPGGSEARRSGLLGPGDMFGEMSLLTGAARSATVATLCPAVLYEIPHVALAPLMQQRPALADAMSKVVTAHQARDAVAAAAASDSDTAIQRRKSTLAESLAARIRAFFASQTAP